MMRRITLRPPAVMSVYPVPSTTTTTTVTSMTDSPEVSTRKRSFKKKTTRDALWGTTTTTTTNLSNESEPVPTTTKTTTKVPTSTTSKKPIFYVTAKPIKPLLSKLSSKSNRHNSTASKFATQFEIITSKSSRVGSGSSEEEDTTVSSSPVLYHRYGTGSNPADTDEIFGSGYVSTDASNSNDVVDEATSTTLEPKANNNNKKFWKQRRTTTTKTSDESSGSSSGEITTLLPNRRRSKELAQYTSPSKMKQYHQLQRKNGNNKPSLSWVNSKEKSSDSGEKVTQASSSTSEEKVSLGPRLKLRLRTFS